MSEAIQLGLDLYENKARAVVGECVGVCGCGGVKG